MAGGPIAAATASPELSESAAVADALGIDGAGAVTSPMEERELLGQLAASRAQRDAEQAAAVASQAQSEQAASAALAEAEAKAAAEAAAAAAAAAAAEAAEAAAAVPGAPPRRGAATAIAKISNSAGRRAAAGAGRRQRGRLQRARRRPHHHRRHARQRGRPGRPPLRAGAGLHGHVDAALGDAIVEYHIAHWDELGVEYIIWQQRMLSLARRRLEGDGEPRQRDGEPHGPPRT